MLPKNLWYLRHGQSTRNLAGKRAYEKNGDSLFEQIINQPSSLATLSELGIEQAVKTGNWLRGHNIKFGRHYTSSHVRAKQTAGLLDLPGVQWYVNNNIRERSGGVMEDMTPAQRAEYLGKLRNRAHLLDLFNFRPDRGESFADIADIRWQIFLSTLHRECCKMDAVLVVNHGDNMWAARSIHERWTPQDFENNRGVEAHGKISNCALLHYTRINPKTGEEVPYLGWYRICCPWKDPQPTAWTPIVRKRYNSSELLNQVQAAESKLKQVS